MKNLVGRKVLLVGKCVAEEDVDNPVRHSLLMRFGPNDGDKMWVPATAISKQSKLRRNEPSGDTVRIPSLSAKDIEA